MISAAREAIERQANEHPLEYVDKFGSMEAYCLHLMHARAYEEAGKLASGLAVLDLGCNNGFGTHYLSGIAASVVGVDVSASALADAQRRFPECDFRHFGGRNLPFRDAEFGLVVSLQVIEHVADTMAFLREIWRVMKPDGTAMFTTPNAAIRLDPGMQPWNRFHVREFLAEELHNALVQVFDSVTVRGLFADEVLYQIEYGRCQSARQSARRALSASKGPQSAAAERSTDWKRLFIPLLKMVLPAPAIVALRKLQHRGVNSAARTLMREEDMARYSTANFFYRDTGFHRALDLMAICRKA